MKRCVECNGERLVERTVERKKELAGHIFLAQVPATVCEQCGETYFTSEEVGRFEQAVALTLARSGENSGAIFQYFRKFLGLRAQDLAGLLGLAKETVSRWENEAREPDRAAVALLGTMVLEQTEGRSTTLERLRALSMQAPLAKKVSLQLEALGV